MKFLNCSFANDNSSIQHINAGFGLVVFDAQVLVQGSDPHVTYFRNLQCGVLNGGGMPSASTVDHMHFENTYVGISDWGSRFARYTNNSFNLPNAENVTNTFTGIYLWQAQLYTVERNLFTGVGNDHNVGVYFKGISPSVSTDQWNYTDSQIYDNTFYGLYAGCIVKDINRGHGQGENDAGLSIFCGDYTDNIYDIAVLSSSILKPDQGHTGGQLSGNRFLNTPNCTTDWDWNLAPDWNHVPGWYNGMHLNVFRNNDPVCDVHCDYWPDFADIPVSSGPWTAQGTCGNGKLDNTHTILLSRAAYALAKSQLDDALNVYNGNLDAGEKPDLIEMLTKEEPPLASSTLRDALLANSPLSDEVMIIMLKREPTMEPWHLTQVLVANVKLNTGVISTAKELLSPFYFGIVNDAQEGSGVTWKELMEQEIGQRRSEKADALASLGYMYATDSTYEGGLDSLRALLTVDADPEYSQLRTELYIAESNWAAVDTELTGSGGKLNGWQNYYDLYQYGNDHAGHWADLGNAEAANLDSHMKAGEAGAALCGSILRSIDLTDYMPAVEFPRNDRSALGSEAPNKGVTTRPSLVLYPNPASTEAYVTWPVKDKGDEIVIMDGQGRVVLEQKAVENGVSRLNLGSLPSGLYKVFLRECGLSTSFSVVR